MLKNTLKYFFKDLFLTEFFTFSTLKFTQILVDAASDRPNLHIKLIIFISYSTFNSIQIQSNFQEFINF